jgi:hypothetical protein
MPPQLRRGSPVGQCKQALPSARYLCQCIQCIGSTAVDPVTNRTAQGRYVGSEEYKKHRRLEEKSGLAPAVSAVNLTVPTFDFTVDPPSPPASPTVLSSIDSASRLSHQDQRALQSGNAFLLMLHSIFKSLESKPVEDVFSGVQLIFHTSPLSDSLLPLHDEPRGQTSVDSREINSGPYALASAVGIEFSVDWV